MPDFKMILNELSSDDVVKTVIDEWNMIKNSGHKKTLSSAKNLITIMSMEWLNFMEEHNNYECHLSLRNELIKDINESNDMDELEYLVMDYVNDSFLNIKEKNKI